MPSPVTDPPESTPATPSFEPVNDSVAEHSVARRSGAWNFAVLAAYQVVMRTGWIFKTESIVMPAVLDSVAGAGWVRGWLPLLNRFGHSVPPLLLAERVKTTRRKKRVLLSTTAVMSLMFLLLGTLFSGPAQGGGWWVPVVFLALYTAFFMAIGVNQITFNTLQGKLVETTHRGRLLLVSNSVGAVSAVVCAFLLLPRWLADAAPRFDLIFGFSGLMFATAAVTSFLLVEFADDYRPVTGRWRQHLQQAWSVWRNDVTFRRLAVVGALFGFSVMLFPHYQALGLQGMDLELRNLVWWVILQNIGTGLFSIPIGRIADRRGNRAVLLIALLGVAAAPLLAVVLHHLGAPGARIFALVFVFVGLTPVVFRTLQNFTLEICPPSEHPRYLSTLAIWTAAPMFLSPGIGLLIDLVGFTAVFLGVAGLVLLGWAIAFGLQEPREHVNFSFYQADD